MTEMLLGGREKISLVEETSFGVGGNLATTGEYVGYNAKMLSPDDDQGYQRIDSAGSGSIGIEGLQAGPESYPFILQFVPTSWKWMKYLLAVQDAGGPVYTHTMTASGVVTSFKLERAMTKTGTDLVYTYTGCTIKKAEISFQKAAGEGTEGFLLVTATCVAKARTHGSSTTTIAAGVLTATAYKYHHVKLTINGNEITEVNNGKLILDHQIDENESRYCNATLSTKIGETIKQTLLVTLQANINTADNTWVTLFDTRIAITGSNKLEFVRATSDDLDFGFGSLYLKKKPDPTVDGITKTDLLFESVGVGTVVATDAIDVY